MRPFPILLFVALNSSFHGIAQNAKAPWSLMECVNYAVENNLAVQQTALQVEVNKNNLETAQWDYAPNLSLGTNYFWNFGLNIDPVTNTISRQSRQTANFQLSSNWLLFNGGRKYKTITRSRLDYTAAILDLESAKNDIRLNVASSFLQVLLNKEIAMVAQEQVQITQLQVDRMARLVEVGSRPEGDLLQLKAQLASDQQNAVSTANAVVLSLVQLANLLQLEDPTGFDVVAPQMKLPGADLVSREALSIYNSAVEIQPAVKAAEKRRQSQEQAVAVARSGYVPTLSLIGQVGSNFSDQIPNITGSQMQVFPIGVVQSTGDIVNSVQQVPISDGVKPFTDQFTDNINELVGLSLQVPIFNRMQVKNNVQNAQVNQEIARLNLEQEKNSLRQTIFQAHADAKAALRQYQAAAQAEEANQKAFDYAKQRFEVGAINQVDFENAKNSLAQAQSQKAQARFDYIFKIKVLEFYLTNQVNL